MNPEIITSRRVVQGPQGTGNGKKWGENGDVSIFEKNALILKIETSPFFDIMND
jgi:hypothetical protein